MFIKRKKKEKVWIREGGTSPTLYTINRRFCGFREFLTNLLSKNLNEVK